MFFEAAFRLQANHDPSHMLNTVCNNCPNVMFLLAWATLLINRQDVGGVMSCVVNCRMKCDVGLVDATTYIVCIKKPQYILGVLWAVFVSTTMLFLFYRINFFDRA